MPSAVSFAWCLIVIFATFIDEGNGKWKSKNRENLQEDIGKLQEMAEKIEEEIEDIYDEYSDNWKNNEYITNEEDSVTMSDTRNNNKMKKYKEKANTNYSISNSTAKVIEPVRTPVPESVLNENSTPKIDTMKEIGSIEKRNIVNSKWPKFEDILLEMGKKYDWKNDRWIKVKKKINQSSEENHFAFHERHKFSYKTVKLNRSKSRRNVVIAVTAVR